MYRILTILILCSLNIFANECDKINQIKKGMNVKQAFIILGPPHTFSEPKNLNRMDLRSKKSLQPKSKVSKTVEDLIDNDPILKSFINAKQNEQNTIVWKFGNKELAVLLKGNKIKKVTKISGCK